MKTYFAETAWTKGEASEPCCLIESAVFFNCSSIYGSLSLSALVNTIIKGLYVSDSMFIRSLSDSNIPTSLSI